MPRSPRNALAPLAAVLFLVKAEANELVPLAAGAAMRRLLPVVSCPWYDAERLPGVLDTCARIVEGIPCYDLRFRPDAEAGAAAHGRSWDQTRWAAVNEAGELLPALLESTLEEGAEARFRGRGAQHAALHPSRGHRAGARGAGAGTRLGDVVAVRGMPGGKLLVHRVVGRRGKCSRYVATTPPCGTGIPPRRDPGSGRRGRAGRAGSVVRSWALGAAGGPGRPRRLGAPGQPGGVVPFWARRQVAEGRYGRAPLKRLPGAARDAAPDGTRARACSFSFRPLDYAVRKGDDGNE